MLNRGGGNATCDHRAPPVHKANTTSTSGAAPTARTELMRTAAAVQHRLLAQTDAGRESGHQLLTTRANTLQLSITASRASPPTLSKLYMHAHVRAHTSMQKCDITSDIAGHTLVTQPGPHSVKAAAA
jgi:hypothetical protein